MSREAEIIAWCDEALGLAHRAYGLLAVDSGAFARVLKERLRPEAVEFIKAFLDKFPAARWYVTKRREADIHAGVDAAIDHALGRFEAKHAGR